MTEIKINVTQRDLNHLLPYHTFYDCCGVVERIMNKVQKKAKELHDTKKGVKKK